MSDSLVVVAHRRGQLHRANLEALTAATELTAAGIAVAVIGDGDNDVTSQLTRDPVDRILELTGTGLHTGYRTLRGLVKITQAVDPAHIVFPHTSVGLEYAPALATRLDRPLLTDITGISDQTTVHREHHDGTEEATLTAPEESVLTVRPGRWGRATGHSDPPVETVTVSAGDDPTPRRLGIQRVTPTPDVLDTSVVVGIGRGVLVSETVSEAMAVADALDAAVGGTRPAVAAGAVDMTAPIGSYGVTPAADVYIALGISGSPRHVAGLSRVETIVAVADDPAVPMLRIADHGIVGDLGTLLPALAAQFGAD